MDNLKNFRRTNYCGDLRLSDAGKTVSLCGWVQRQRDLGGLIFVDLRDRTGLIQLSFDDSTDKEIFEKASGLRSEYVIAATGLVRERESKTNKIATGDIEVCFNQYEVRLRGQKVDLTAKEFEILALLAASPGQVFTRAQIYEHIWGGESDVDESSITVFIRKIREKIEDNPSQPKYLLTVWRVGYKFAERV